MVMLVNNGSTSSIEERKIMVDTFPRRASRYTYTYKTLDHMEIYVQIPPLSHMRRKGAPLTILTLRSSRKWSSWTASHIKQEKLIKTQRENLCCSAANNKGNIFSTLNNNKKTIFLCQVLCPWCCQRIFI